MQNRSGIRFGLSISSVVDETIENLRLKTEQLQGRHPREP